MFTTFGYKTLGREGCYERRVAASPFKAEGHVTVFVSEISY